MGVVHRDVKGSGNGNIDFVQLSKAVAIRRPVAQGGGKETVGLLRSKVLKSKALKSSGRADHSLFLALSKIRSKGFLYVG